MLQSRIKYKNVFLFVGILSALLFLFSGVWGIYNDRYLHKCQNKQSQILKSANTVQIINDKPENLVSPESWAMETFGNRYIVPAVDYKIFDITLNTDGRLVLAVMVSEDMVSVSIFPPNEEPDLVRYIEKAYKLNSDNLSCLFYPLSSFDQDYIILSIQDPGAIYSNKSNPQLFMTRIDYPSHSIYTTYNKTEQRRIVSYSYYGSDSGLKRFGEDAFYNNHPSSTTPDFIKAFASYIENPLQAGTEQFKKEYGIELRIHKLYGTAPKNLSELFQRMENLGSE